MITPGSLTTISQFPSAARGLAVSAPLVARCAIAFALTIQLVSCAERPDVRFGRNAKRSIPVIKRLDQELYSAYARLRTTSLAMDPQYLRAIPLALIDTLRAQVSALPAPHNPNLVAFRSGLDLFPEDARRVVDCYDTEAAFLQRALVADQLSYEAMGEGLARTT